MFFLAQGVSRNNKRVITIFTWKIRKKHQKKKVKTTSQCPTIFDYAFLNYFFFKKKLYRVSEVTQLGVLSYRSMRELSEDHVF